RGQSFQGKAMVVDVPGARIAHCALHRQNAPFPSCVEWRFVSFDLNPAEAVHAAHVVDAIHQGSPAWISRKPGTAHRMARSFVSGRKTRPTTAVARAISTGYQRPAKMLPWYIMSAEAANGKKPPRMPTPRW